MTQMFIVQHTKNHQGRLFDPPKGNRVKLAQEIDIGTPVICWCLWVIEVRLTSGVVTQVTRLAYVVVTQVPTSHVKHTMGDSLRMQSSI